MTERISRTCYIDEGKMLAVVQLVDEKKWRVIDENASIVFGPDSILDCFDYVSEQEDVVQK